jgi:hypothetical protein
MLRSTSFVAVVAGLVLQAAIAAAFPTLPAQVAATYPAATNLVNCGTCHVSFDGSDAAANPYGAAFAAAGFDFAAIEGDDSDGDGTSNIDEINSDTGFFPGWTCETYTGAVAAPADLADFVDPVDPGCTGGGTTTTTIVTTTTSTTTSTLVTTTTTLPGEPKCSQPVSDGPAPVATDCLFILQAAVGSQTCDPECLCAPTGTLPAKATDALLCLQHSVGNDAVPLNCPCNGVTTTSTTSTTVGEPTTTSTSTTVEGPTTTSTSTTVEGPTTTSTTTTVEAATTTTTSTTILPT